MNPRAIIIHTDDLWEGIYLDGKLYDQGHTLGEGHSTLYLLAFAEKHGLSFKDFTTGYLDPCEELSLGSLPHEIDNRFEIDDQLDLDYVLG